MKKLIRTFVNWAYGFEVDQLLTYNIGTIAKYNLEKVDKLPDSPKDCTIYLVTEKK